MDELRHQLDKLGGRFDTVDQTNGQASTQTNAQRDEQSMYPSIRKLPVLGVMYADLYRNTKVQEAIL